MARRSWSIFLLAYLLVLATACANSSAPASLTAAPRPTTAAAAPTTISAAPSAAPAVSGAGKEVIVFAAASLTDSFNEISAAFSARTGGTKVTFNYGGSNTLRAQIEQGAPADVFASANGTEMNTLVKDGLVTVNPVIFGKNRLVVIIPKSNPGKIQRLQDLGNPGLKIVAAGPNVPVGGYMLQMLDKMNADPSFGAGFKDKFMKNVISQETDVKQVVAKVQLGEGDAGVVYSTDVTPKVMPDVHVIDVPDAFNVIAQYPIAVTRDAKQKELGQALVNYIAGPDGQAVLKKYNFIALK